jgi:transglutaminase-like putative cysteine protease
MGRDRVRLATTVSLALGCAALGYAEYPLLPEVGWAAAVVVGALVVIDRVEGRIRLLSIPDANRLGAGITVVIAGWAAIRVIREYNRAEFTGLGWPVFMVCLAGMLILAVIPAKLLRRDKHAGDYWQLYLAGLGAAVLAGAMADDLFGFALLGAYAAAGVWALAEFHAARAAGRVPPVPGGVAVKVAVAERGGRNEPLTLPLPLPLVWAAVAVATAVPLYLVTPRSTFGKLDFDKHRVEIGYAADQMVDLTRTGDLKANPEEAFAVRVTDAAGRPADALDPAQRWRGAVLTHYRAGGWTRDDHLALPAAQRTARNARPWRPPDFGPDRLRLAFAVPARLRAEFLADPAHWVPGEPVPVADLTPAGPVGWYVLPDGSFVRPPGEAGDGPTVEYVQHTRRPAEPDLGPGFFLAGPPDRVFVTNPVGRVKEYADGVVRDGVAAGRLPAALARLPAGLPPHPEYHEAIAREFARHLGEHPELRYTTAVRRGNQEVDPVEDFLFYTKAGHCERFASALVLMLRSQAIPSVLVLGFKGCEPAGDGRYVVRQEFAHAWAEALIVRPAPPGVRATRQWHWLALDPSPAAVADPAEPAGADGLLGRVRAFGRETVGKYLTNYTRERRDEALRAAWEFARHPATLGGAAGLVGLGFAGWAVRRLARRRAARANGSSRLDPFYAALAGMGYHPNPGDTPLEFARAVAADLRRRGLTEADGVDVPVEWVEGYYRDRFGGEPADGTRADLDARLFRLRDALRTRTGGQR